MAETTCQTSCGTQTDHGPVEEIFVDRLTENHSLKRLHINVGFYCNNNCVFCMEDGRKGRYEMLKSITEEDVVRMIKGQGNVHEVCFTSGEPTLNPRLPNFIHTARKMGVPEVSMISNGRMFANIPFTMKVLQAGLNIINISIHGHTKRLHEGLVRAPGAFEQIVAGIRNLSILGKKTGLKLRTSTVINRRNLEYMKELIEFLEPFSIEQYVFNVIMPSGRGLTLMDQLGLPYHEVVEAYNVMLKKLKRRVPVFLVDIPHCATEAVPDYNRGFVEQRLIYESQANQQEREMWELMRNSGESEEEFILHMETYGKIKLPRCQECVYNGGCEGIWKPYIDVFGTGEFQPVTGTKAQAR